MKIVHFMPLPENETLPTSFVFIEYVFEKVTFSLGFYDGIFTRH